MRMKKRILLTILVSLGLFITTSHYIEHDQTPNNKINIFMDEPIDGNH